MPRLDPPRPVNRAVRPLTVSEWAKIDAAWDRYLDVAKAAVKSTEIVEAWGEYWRVLDSLHVISTLQGYLVETRGSHVGQRQRK